MISEFLFAGAENAQSSTILCKKLNITRRELSQAVETERRQGAPICASTDRTAPGYYLAADKKEMQDFCGSLSRRAGEIHKTRRACLKTIEQLPDGNREGI